MSARRYRIGIDVGLNSVGLAAIEVDDDGMPIRILNAQSVIHDGGVDPTKNKEAITRKNISGEARRTRRMLRRRRKRLHELDEVLRKAGYPIIGQEFLTDPFEEWYVRAELADRFIEDDEERRESISIALRHMARHRGWRNPWHRVDSLLVDNPYSEQYQDLRARVRNSTGHAVKDGLTPAQIVERAFSYGHDEAPRLRMRKKTNDNREGLLPQKMMQEDNANELKAIFAMQRIPRDEWEPLFRKVFFAVSPKGSAEERVGIDPLDPSQKRALKASLAFQRYRIANVLANLRIRENRVDRPLTVEERQRAFGLLASERKDELNWSDVAEELGFARIQLRGVGKLPEDGGERVSAKPPRMDSLRRIGEADRKIAKPLTAWWKDASDEARESMIRLLSNTVGIDRINDDPAYGEALWFIDALDDDGVAKLDSVDLPSGRAAYGEQTLRRLTERMLTTEDGLHEARKALFHVSDYWRPPADPIGAPLGNPSADRVLKIVNQWLRACENRWGQPESVQVEHVRSGFDSVATARQYERRNGLRSAYRDVLAQKLRGGAPVNKSSLRRIEAIQRQNGLCLYCGRPIAFQTCEMDHIVPRSGPGSTNTRTNLAAVCIDCNQGKSNVPFAVWVNSVYARQRGIRLKDALDRVKNFQKDAGYDAKGWRNFKQEVMRRLRQTEEDEAIDSRSIESVAWMADELHRRIDWHFNAQRYLTDDGAVAVQPDVKVAVFQGRVTAAARRAGGIEKRIHFFGGKGKTRLDRRHHAVDAAVIALMRLGVAQTLMERESMREEQIMRRVAGPAPGERSWKEYPFEGSASYGVFVQWRNAMNGLADLLNDALDNGRIVVRQPTRLALGNSIAHDATVRKLRKVRLGDAIDATTIRHASTPALWCALTRLPDYDAKLGLPENPNREIHVHGVRYGADEKIGFFASDAAQVMVCEGSADIGSAIHHARVYRCWTSNAKGVRKYWYGMIRVFQTDLNRYRGDDLFTAPLPPQSVSMRYGEGRTVQAVQEGNAEYLGWLVVGDEIHVDLSEKVPSGQGGEFANWTKQLGMSSASETWVLAGFEGPSLLKLRPRMLAAEGMSKTFVNEAVPSGAVGVVSGKGWRPSVDVFAGFHPVVIRRNTLGEPRWHSKSGLPCSWRWTE